MPDTTDNIVRLAGILTTKSRPLYVDGTLIGYKVPVRELDRLRSLISVQKESKKDTQGGK